MGIGGLRTILYYDPQDTNIGMTNRTKINNLWWRAKIVLPLGLYLEGKIRF